jgi:hypothetical protein
MNYSIEIAKLLQIQKSKKPIKTGFDAGLIGLGVVKVSTKNK